MDAVPYFKFSFLERRMENTEAASVEPRTAPMSIPSRSSMPSTYQQKIPVSRAVNSTPSVERTMDFAATGRASRQLVPKPP